MSHTSIRHIFLLLGLVASACDDQVDPSQYEGEPLVTLRGHVNTNGTSVAADVGILWHLSTEDAACQGPTIFCSSAAAGSTNPDFVSCKDACDAQFGECNDITGPQLQACYAACGGTFDYQLKWRTCGDVGVGARATVDAEFPASFTLDVLDPPPASAMMTDGSGVSAAIGYIVGLDPAASNPTFVFDADEVPEVIGSVPDHALVYAPAAIPAESGWGQYLGGAYPAGFHLIASVDAGKICFNEACDVYETGGSKRIPAPQGLGTQLTLHMGEYQTLGFPGL